MKTIVLFVGLFIMVVLMAKGQKKKEGWFSKADHGTFLQDSTQILWGNVCCISNNDTMYADSAIVTKDLHYTLIGNVRVITGGKTIIKSQKVNFVMPY